MSAVDISTLAVEVRSTGVKETADGLNKVFQEAKKAEDRVETLTGKIEKLSTVFSQGSATATAFMQSMALAKTANAATDQTAKELTASIKILNESVKVLGQNMDQLGSKSRKSAEAITFNKKAMDDAHAAARGLSGSLGALWVTYGNMLPLAAGLALGTAFKSVVTQGASLQNTLESLRVKGQETVESVEAIGRSVAELGKGVYGPQEVAKAFETLILAGLNAKQALSGIRDALNLATVGGTSIEKSAYTLVQVGTSLGYSAESFNRISDVIAKTAAVSMSSVESLSEAFKSGASVGKLYGASLEDIGTALAALSNLGIQGSAAGTSLKNFYKELASESKKVSGTFKEIGLSQKELKDPSGNFLPLAQLLPKLNDALAKYAEADQKLILNRLANERGLKTLVELLDLYRQKGESAATAFAQLQGEIENSYGFAATGAAQLSLTVENQFKSVKNTLATTFASIGESISPQMTVLANDLKKTFTSQEFVSGVRQVAEMFANLGVTLASNIPVITKVVEAILAMKGFMFVVDAFVAIRTAFVGASAAATALGLTLGPLTAALTAATAAYIYFTRAKSDSELSSTAKAAIQNTNDYVEALDKEAERLETQLRLLKENKSAREAETQSIVAQQLAMAKAEGNKAKMEAEARLERAGANVTLKDIEISDSIVKRGGMATAAVKEFKDAQANLARVNAQVDSSFDRLVQRQKHLLDVSKQLEDQRKANEANKPSVPSGSKTLPEDPQKISGIQNEIIMLDKLTASYKSKAKTLTESSKLEVEQIGNEQRAKVEAEIADGKYADSKNKAYIEALRQAADRADIAKYELDRTKALHEMQSKVTSRMDVENELLKEANSGHSKLVGTYEAEVKALQKKWQIDPAGAEQKKLSDEARELDKIVAAKERAMKFNKGTDNINADAKSLLDQGDAIMLYGKHAKQTALELAQVQIEKAKLDKTTQEGIIIARLQAAAYEDMALAYRDMAKLAQELDDQNRKHEADMVAEILSSEAEKVMAKRETMLKAIEFSIQEAEAAKRAAEAAGGMTPDQETAYQKAIESRAAAMRELDKATALGLSSAAVKDMNTLLEQSKSLASDLESSFGSVGKAIGGMTSAFTAYAKSQTKLQESLKLADAERSKNSVKANKIEQEARRTSTVEELKSYADMTGAAKMFFNEKSRGYQVLQGIERAFRAAELAMELQHMIKKIFFTETVTAAKVSAIETETAANAASVAPNVAAEGTKATASGITAFAKTLASLPFPLNVAAGAAVMALLVGAGVKMSGGGSATVNVAKERQAVQGTGTVLGDENAKSDSIKKSLEFLKSNSDIALSYSSSMVQFLRSIDSGISGMAALVSQSSGLRGTSADQRALGVGSSKSFLGFSSSSTELVDSGILLERIETSADKAANAAALEAFEKARAEFNQIEGPIDYATYWLTTPAAKPKPQTSSQTVGSVVTEGLLAKAYADLHSESSSFFGLSRDSSDEERLSNLPKGLEERFSKTVASMFESVLTAAKSLGNNNAVIADAVKNISLTDVIPNGKISLKGLSGSEVEKELQAVFGSLGDKMAEVAMPGLKGFWKNSEGYFQTLMRVANGVEVANYALEKLNITSVKYTDVINKQGDVATEIIRDSIVAAEKLNGVTTGVGEIITTLDGSATDLVDTYKQLVDVRNLMNGVGLKGGNLTRNTIRGAGGLDSLKTGINDFFSNFYSSTEQAAIKTSLLNKEFSALGTVMPKTKDEFKALVLQMDDGTEAGDKLVGKLLSLAGAFNDVSDATEKAAKDVADKLLNTVSSAFDSLSRSVEAEKKRVTSLYDSLITAAKKKIEDDIAAVKKQADTDVASQKDRLKIAEDAQKAISDVFDALKNALKSTQVESAALSDARRKEAQSLLKAADAWASVGGSLAGYAGLTDALQTVAKPSEQLFSSFEDYARDQAMTANTISHLASLAEKQKTAAQLTIEAINGTIEAINTASSSQISALKDAGDKQVATLESARDTELARLDVIVTTAQAELDALHGIDNSVKSVFEALYSFSAAVSAAKANPTVSSSAVPVATPTATSTALNASRVVDDLYNNVLGRQAEASGFAYWQQTIASHPEKSLDVIVKDFIGGALAGGTATDKARAIEYAHSHNIPGFAVGTNYVPEDMVAQIHEGERIIPAADNVELMRRLGDEDSKQNMVQLSADIKDLKQCIMSGDIANVQNLKELIRFVRKWDGDGLPETRDTTT